MTAQKCPTFTIPRLGCPIMEQAKLLTVGCPTCNAPPGERCVPLEAHSEIGRAVVAAGLAHSERYEALAARNRDAGVIR